MKIRVYVEGDQLFNDFSDAERAFAWRDTVDSLGFSTVIDYIQETELRIPSFADRRA